MVKNFTLELPSFDYRTEKQNTKEFKNYCGTWSVRIFSTSSVFSGFMTLNPSFEIQQASIKQIKVKFSFQNQGSSSYNHEKDAMIDGKMMVFFFVPFQFSSYNYYNYKIDVKIEVPEILNQTSVVLGSSKGHLLELFNTKKLADITIKTKGNEFKVHKFILVRSQVFDKMLNTLTLESQTGIIEITDIKHEVLYEMCRFLYIDEIPKIKEYALELLIAADKYNIPGLASKCGQYLMNNMAVESFYDVLVVADKLNVKDLKDTAIDYIIENRKTIFSCEGWKNLKKNHMSIAMEVSEKYMANS